MNDDCRCANSYYRNKPVLKLETQTTTKSAFQPYPIQKQPEFQVPKVVQRHYEPSALQTSYKTTYTQPPIQKDANSNGIDSLSRHLMNKPKNVPFYSETQYKTRYPKHDVKPQKQPAYEYKPKPTKFEGQTSYKAEFIEKKNPDFGQSVQGGGLKDYINRKPKVPFEGRTSYNDTFTNPDVKPVRQPEYKYQPKGTKFEGESSYKATFKMPEQSAYGKTEYCPVHPEKVAIK